MDKKNILIVGAGYVGSSCAVAFGNRNAVTIFDIDSKKIESFKKNKYPLEDSYAEKINLKDLDISAKDDLNSIDIGSFEFIFICLPTDFSSIDKKFDTSLITNFVQDNYKKFSKESIIVIKSTVYIGFTESIHKEFDLENLVVSPEFLREGTAIEDSIFPSRVVIGSFNESNSNRIIELIKSSIQSKCSYHSVSASEAESIKLFSNTYLAMRVSFFNELDTFAMSEGLDTQNIIEGICSDNRIGNSHNNPSFGYGGYCLPKDSKQLQSDFKNIPEELITATIESNIKRKQFIAQKILEHKPNKIGVYRLSMKKGSRNYKSSSILDILELIKDSSGAEIIIYEPSLKVESFQGSHVEKNLENFLQNTDLIIANRIDKDLDSVKNKVFSRDIYNIN